MRLEGSEVPTAWATDLGCWFGIWLVWDLVGLDVGSDPAQTSASFS